MTILEQAGKTDKLVGRLEAQAKRRLRGNTHTPSPGAHKYWMDDEEMDGVDDEKDDDEMDEKNLEGHAPDGRKKEGSTLAACQTMMALMVMVKDDVIAGRSILGAQV